MKENNREAVQKNHEEGKILSSLSRFRFHACGVKSGLRKENTGRLCNALRIVKNRESFSRQKILKKRQIPEKMLDKLSRIV